jgi:uncharacterized repeat protein (TIGR01451 family)
MRTRFINLFLRPALIAGLGLTLTFDDASGASGVADLSLSASVSRESSTSDLIYSITVSNAGPSAATGVVISNQIPTNALFISATGGVTPTNGVLLVPLGSLTVGATNSAQIVVQYAKSDTNQVGLDLVNMFQVLAEQADPNPTNNFLSVITSLNTTSYTTSTRTIETNLTANVNLLATNYSTRLIAVMPGGSVLYDQTFDAAFSDPAVEAAVTQAAGDLTGAGATSYNGPTPTNPLGSLSFVGSSSGTATNVIGTDTSLATSLYIGPQMIMVGDNQSQPFYILAGCMTFDTLITTVVTNLVTTTNTDTYLNSAVYTMIAIVPQPELGLAAVRSNQFGFTITGTSNLSIVVEACTNLATPSWTTLELFKLTNGPIYFSDPAWRSYPMRFYRTRLP